MQIIILECKGILDIGLIGGLVERIKNPRGFSSRSPSDLPEIKCAASLARYNLLGPVRGLTLSGVDLTSMPADNLASLVSCVTESVDIKDVSGCGLLTTLDCVKSKLLTIREQSLDSEETRALVRAMESRMRQVVYLVDRTLDIRAVMEYSGQGKCWVVVMFDHDTKSRYEEDLRTLAQNRNWQVNEGSGGWFEIHKKRYI